MIRRVSKLSISRRGPILRGPLPSLKLWDSHRKKPREKSGKAHLFEFPLYEHLHFVDGHVWFRKLSSFVTPTAIHCARLPICFRPAPLRVLFQWHSATLTVLVCPLHRSFSLVASFQRGQLT